MADTQNLLGRLADAGEEAISKVNALNRLSTTITSLRERVDDMQKRLRGLDEVEKRLAALEKRVDELAKPKRSSSSSSKSRSSAPKRAAS
jgi:hypothetical protein